MGCEIWDVGYEKKPQSCKETKLQRGRATKLFILKFSLRSLSLCGEKQVWGL